MGICKQIIIGPKIKSYPFILKMKSTYTDGKMNKDMGKWGEAACTVKNTRQT